MAALDEFLARLPTGGPSTQPDVNEEAGWPILSFGLDSEIAITTYGKLCSSLREDRREAVKTIFNNLTIINVSEAVASEPVSSTIAPSIAPFEVTAVFRASKHDALVILALRELLFNESVFFRPFDPSNELLYTSYCEALYSRWYLAYAYLCPTKFPTLGIHTMAIIESFEFINADCIDLQIFLQWSAEQQRSITGPEAHSVKQLMRKYRARPFMALVVL
jgi:hypothetical protein